MHVVRSTIDLVTNPFSMLTRFANLVFNELPLLKSQNLRVFIHFRSRFQFTHRIRHLPTFVIFDPAMLIARKPSSIGCDGDEERNWIVHQTPPLVTGRVSVTTPANVPVYPRLRVGLPFTAFIRPPLRIRVYYRWKDASRHTFCDVGNPTRKRGQPAERASVSSLTHRVTIFSVHAISISDSS